MHFDRPRLERLKKALEEAKACGAGQFVFEGRLLLVSYARYLVEYLEGRL